MPRCRPGGAPQPEVADVEVRVDLPAPARPEPATYFTDGSVLQQAVGGAPVVIWGPGTPAVMHARDEYVEVAELEAAAAAFGAVVARWR